MWKQLQRVFVSDLIRIDAEDYKCEQKHALRKKIPFLLIPYVHDGLMIKPSCIKL